ncbi:MAG: efflux transporter outer membrane subunit [Chromatiales bacterium]|nr:MAG: efflux transporter outer membrane subunit [Chromatiales bacterium]
MPRTGTKEIPLDQFFAPRRLTLARYFCSRIILPALGAAAFLGAGCTTSGISVAPEDVEAPEAWVRGGDAGEVEAGWLASFSDPTLDALVAESMVGNRALKQDRLQLQIARQAAAVARSSRFPAFDLGLDGSRREFEDEAGDTISVDTYSATVSGRFDVDLWGELSKAQQAAELSVAAQEARVQGAEYSVAGTIAGQYFDVLEATQLLTLAESRLENTQASHDIVASGYRQGLNDALDLYLARNQVERERASLAQQQQSQREAMAALQLSLARYPHGEADFSGELPVLNDPVPTGLPSELLLRRPDLREAWLNLLAADADLAAAHKARFPQLLLTGSTGATSVRLSELLDGGFSNWSLAFGLTQPLFDAGRLAAIEEQALMRLRIAEEAWLGLVYDAFADVENAVSRRASLETRYEAFLEAEKNSRAALDLALDQYQRGLVTYTTVLESQRQAFDAEATVVQLRNQRLQNRLALYLALGGDFDGSQ